MTSGGDCEGPTALWRSVPLLGPSDGGLLEPVDDAYAVEIVEPGQVLRVEDFDAGFDTRREIEGIPEGRSSCKMELLCAHQIGVGRPDERQQIPELGEAIPGRRSG
jgi:hypothetical protein